MSIGSVLLLPFLPAAKLMGKINYTYKILLILFFLLTPTIYSLSLIYNDFQLRSDNLTHTTQVLRTNSHLYEMVVALKALEYDAIGSFEAGNTLELMQLEQSQKKARSVQENLLRVLDGKTKEICSDYYERVESALLNKESEMFIQQVYAYQNRLLMELNELGIDKLSTDMIFTSDMAYLLSTELPLSYLLTSELKMLRFDKHEKRKLFMKIGELKTLVNKTDTLLQRSKQYKEYFEESSSRYQRTLSLYTKHLLNGEMDQAEVKEKTLLDIQSSLFTQLNNRLKDELDQKKKALDKEGQTLFLFIFAMLSGGFYLLVGSYLNVKSSMASFSEAAKKISQGSFKSRVRMKNSDEMGQLSQEFNEMIEELDYNQALFDEYQKAVGSSVLTLKTDINGMITDVNKAFENVSGYSKEELIGSTLSKMRSANTTHEQLQELWDAILNNRIYKAVFENIAKNGKSFFVETTVVPILDRKGKISEFISIMLDVTPMYKQKRTLHAQVYKDELTSLPNRMKLTEDISNTQSPKLIIINIDGFKEINTIFGEAIGDETLQKMAVAIKDAAQTHYLQLYKLSGDEFAILAGNEVSIEMFKEDVATLSRNLSHTKLICGEHEISVRLTIGAVMSELHLSQISLISMANMAMKEAKRRSRPFMFYQEVSSLEEDLEKNYKMVQHIEKAIKEDAVRCCYQGIVDAKTGKIVKYETLMRIDGDDGKVMTPNSFINIAKRARYYPKLTQKMFQEAVFTFLKREEDFTVNLSIDDIMDDKTYAFILDILNNCGCAERIVFEFLENEEIEFNDRILDFTKYVKGLGSKIAIDDFGSGYSNYAYLMRLGVDILKIDATLIKDLATDENCRLITQSIIDIAHALGMETVAEHVHTKEVAELVTSMGTDYIQGFYLHKPKYNI